MTLGCRLGSTAAEGPFSLGVDIPDPMSERKDLLLDPGRSQSPTTLLAARVRNVGVCDRDTAASAAVNDESGQTQAPDPRQRGIT